MAQKKPAKAAAEIAAQPKLSKEEAALVAAMQDTRPVEGNIVSASILRVVWAGNDCTLIWDHPRPAVNRDGSPAAAAVIETVAMVSVSAATMKDISILISEQVAKHEAKFGAIETIFTKKRAASKKSSTKH